MDLETLQADAMRVHALYDELNHRERGRTWTREEFVLGFMGDLGDLAKLVLAAELADCLWSVLVLAKLYDIDLASEFDRLTTGLAERIGNQLQAPGRR